MEEWPTIRELIGLIYAVVSASAKAIKALCIADEIAMALT